MLNKFFQLFVSLFLLVASAPVTVAAQEVAQEDGLDPVFRHPRRHGRYDFGWPVIAPGIGF